ELILVEQGMVFPHNGDLFVSGKLDVQRRPAEAVGAAIATGPWTCLDAVIVVTGAIAVRHAVGVHGNLDECDVVEADSDAFLIVAAKRNAVGARMGVSAGVAIRSDIRRIRRIQRALSVTPRKLVALPGIETNG